MEFKEVAELIYRYDAALPGPTVAIVGGTHGNERTGIEIVRSLRGEMPRVSRGSLILAFGNPKAIVLGERSSTPNDDLNRCFQKVALEGEGDSYEHQRARVLAAALRNADVILDIHATNKPSLPFVVFQPFPDERYHKIVRHFGTTVVLTDPRFIFAGEHVTLDEFAVGRGQVGICYETGLASDTSRVSEVRREVLAILDELRMIKWHSAKEGTPTTKQIFALTQAILLTHERFDWVGGFGTENFEEVKKGQVFGRRGGFELMAMEDSLIVFPKIRKLWRLGKPVGYLAKKI
jgi:succinylglutamate desuccinylase